VQRQPVDHALRAAPVHAHFDHAHWPASYAHFRPSHVISVTHSLTDNLVKFIIVLECGPMPNVMAALPNIGGILCSTPQSLDDVHY